MRRLLPLAVALLMLGLWQRLSIDTPAVLLPSPAEVLAATQQHHQELLSATLETAWASALGLGLATLIAVLGGLLFVASRWLEWSLYPYALLIQTLPVVAIAPLLVVWLGYGTGVSVTTAALVAFFPMLNSAHAGLQSPSRSQLELMQSYGASWWRTMWSLRLPAAQPAFFTGLRAGGGLAIIGAIVGEFVGSNGLPPTLGYLILRSSRAAQTELSFAAIAAAALLSLVAFGLCRLAEHLALHRWHGGG